MLPEALNILCLSLKLISNYGRLTRMTSVWRADSHTSLLITSFDSGFCHRGDI